MDASRGGVLLAMIGAALFALRPVLVKLIYGYEVDALTIMTWRMAFALPCYMVVLVWIYRRGHGAGVPRVTILAAAGVGVIGYYVAAYFDLLGLQYVSAQLGRLILYTYPTMVALLGWWLFRHALTRRTGVALLVSYTGVALIFLHDINRYGSEVLVGTIWVLSAALCFSLYLVFSKPLITVLGSLLFTCIAMIAASIVIMIHFASVKLVPGGWQPDSLVPGLPALGLIFLMSIASTVMPSFLISAAIARVGSTRTGISGSFGPAMTSLFAVLLLGEKFTAYHAIGMVMVVGAIALSTTRETRISGN